MTWFISRPLSTEESDTGHLPGRVARDWMPANMTAAAAA